MVTTCEREREREMYYLTTHSTHFIYGYMASDIWLMTILIVRKETRCRHIGYSYRLTARVLLYATSHREDNTYHGLCYTSRGALAGTRNILNGSTPRWRIDPTTHRYYLHTQRVANCDSGDVTVVVARRGYREQCCAGYHWQRRCALYSNGKKNNEVKASTCNLESY